AKIVDPNIFFQPNIPPKKLSGAQEVYAKDVRSEDILVLIDNTMRGNAKDGAVLTDTHFYAHSTMEKPVSIELGAIETVSFKEGWSSKLIINGIPFLDINFPKKEAMRLVTRMLEEIASVLHAPPVEAPPTTKSPAEALKELKALLDAGIITESEFQAKREKYISQL
ncbi:MAG: SHOCT domain-containing protein, partial [Chloroflexi bacterium]|nr:SHOCT domain-containing protein [Chloroflexota bacterium]